MSATPQQKTAFVKLLAPALQGLGLSARTQLMIVTHAAYESAWGVCKAATGFNFWNMSAGPYWKGKTQPGPDTEFKPGAKPGDKPVAIVQQWRVYDTVQDGVKDYLSFLTYPRYLPARAALMNGDPTGFIELLGPDKSTQKPPVGGYFTLPTITYMQNFNAVMSEVLVVMRSLGLTQE